jgi:hypothetical protein
VFEIADFGEETFVEDADIGAFQAGGREDVNDSIVGHDGVGGELTDGGVDCLWRTVAVGRFFPKTTILETDLGLGLR